MKPRVLKTTTSVLPKRHSHVFKGFNQPYNQENQKGPTIKRTSDGSTISTLNRGERCANEDTAREIAFKLHLQQAHYFLLRLYVKPSQGERGGGWKQG